MNPLLFLGFALAACATTDLYALFEYDFSGNLSAAGLTLADPDAMTQEAGQGVSGGYGLVMDTQSNPEITRGQSTEEDFVVVTLYVNVDEVKLNSTGGLLLGMFFDSNWNTLFKLQVSTTDDLTVFTLLNSDGSEKSSAATGDTGYIKFRLWITRGESVEFHFGDSSSVAIFLDMSDTSELASNFRFGVISIWGEEDTSPHRLKIDELSIETIRRGTVYVDCEKGDDGNSGLALDEPFKTIAHAVSLAQAGTKIYVRGGVCRLSETIYFNNDNFELLTYQGEVVDVLGSSRYDGWTLATSSDLPDVDESVIGKVYYVSMDAEPAVVYGSDVGMRLRPARYPNWSPGTPIWNYTMEWLLAKGATEVETCDTSVSSNCDPLSKTLLCDPDVFNSTNPSFVGARIRVIDGYQGTYTYYRTVESENADNGTITLDRDVDQDGIGRFSKYYLEGLQWFLNDEGEYWYDSSSGRMYVYPYDSQNLSDIEFSVLDTAILIRDSKNVRIGGKFVFKYFSDYALVLQNWDDEYFSDIEIDGIEIQTSVHGLKLLAYHPSTDYGYDLSNIAISNSRFFDIDAVALSTLEYWPTDFPNVQYFGRALLKGVRIANNRFEDIGFKPTGSSDQVAISLGFANEVEFVGNHVERTAHIGLQLSWAARDSSGTALTKDILIRDNTFTQSCLMNCDCACIKFWNDNDSQTDQSFENALVYNNTMSDTIGYSECAYRRYWWTLDTIRGEGGFAFYNDFASGISYFRNIGWNLGVHGTQFSASYLDGKTHIYNNIIAGAGSGYAEEGSERLNKVAPQNMIMANNIFVRMLGDVFSIGKFSDKDDFLGHDYDWFAFTETPLSHNLWWEGLLTCWDPKTILLTLDDMRAYDGGGQSGTWGDHSLNVSTISFANYTEDHYDRYDWSVPFPDFHLSDTQENPDLLRGAKKDLDQDFLDLLEHFNIPLGLDPSGNLRWGAYPYESDGGDDGGSGSAVAWIIGIAVGVAAAAGAFLYIKKEGVPNFGRSRNHAEISLSY